MQNNARFFKKYRYLGNFGLSSSIPDGWEDLVKDMIVRIDRTTRPKYIPRIILNLIHDLAIMPTHYNGIRSIFWYKVFKKLYSECEILQIKEKFAALRVYHNGSQRVDDVVLETIVACKGVCQKCGNTKHITTIQLGSWLYNLCHNCIVNFKSKGDGKRYNESTI